MSRISEQLGDYLHAQRQHRSVSDPWWLDFAALVELGCSLLEDANFGRMLGPPLLEQETGACFVVVEVDSDAGPSAELARIGKPGESVEFEVAYLDSLEDARGDAA